MKLGGYGPTLLDPHSFVLRSWGEGLEKRSSSRRQGTVKLPRCSQLLESWVSVSPAWEALLILPSPTARLQCQPALVPNPEGETPNCKNSKRTLIYSLSRVISYLHLPHLLYHSLSLFPIVFLSYLKVSWRPCTLLCLNTLLCFS